jgi:SAM-dependent methyltransferase
MDTRVTEAAEYDRWYESPRGQWIGRREVELLLRTLAPRPGESLLDVGCGTGFFTRGLAERTTGCVLGVDINREWVQYARRRDEGRASYAGADARALPFQTGSFDLVVSVAALCFIRDELAALREILRVTRRRFAIGLLNRRSLLWLQKGRRGGSGGYRGARWHTVREVRALFGELPVQHLDVQTAVQVPSGGAAGRLLERMCPSAVPTGGFLLIAGDVVDDAR